MNSLSELQSIVSQMETQISEDLCTALLNEVTKMQSACTARPNLLVPVKMIHAMGSYLKTHMDRSHPDTWSVLKTTVDKLELLLEQDQVEKKDVQPLVDHYRLFQNKLASRPDVDVSEIENLKVAILAVDWEISEQNLQSFQTELSSTMDRFRDYNVQYTLLKMIQSTGRYIAAHKVNAHSDSLIFLRSIFETLELIIRTPEMPFAQKKNLLKQSIRKFQDFKTTITGQTVIEPTVGIDGPTPPVTKPSAQEEPVPDITPALSHIKPEEPGTTGADDISPLTVLDDNASPDAPRTGIGAGASSGKIDPGEDGKDVMDDLFSIKESPADELLDAIHLLDVHGAGPDKALSMLDAASGQNSDDARNLSPKRPAKDPIREIDDALDEFFNLGTSSGGPETRLEAQIVEEEARSDYDSTPGDVEPPVGEEENRFDSSAPPPEKNQEPELDSAPLCVKPHEIIEWLKTELSQLKAAQTAFDNTAFEEKIDLLKYQWAEDKDKKDLVEVIASALSIVQMYAPAKETDETDADSPETPAPPKTSKGFMGRIKGFFASR